MKARPAAESAAAHAAARAAARAAAPDPAIRSAGTEALVAGILAETEEKIAALEREAGEYAAGRVRTAQSRAEAILARGRESAAARTAAIGAEAESRLAMERSGKNLEAEETFMRRVLDLAASEFAAASGRADYPGRVLVWLCEAAVGLAVPRAIVEAGERERAVIPEAMLEEVRATVGRLTGLEPELRLSGSPADAGTLRLLTEDGRIVYDTGVRARLARAEPAIRALVRGVLDRSGREDGADAGTQGGGGAGEA